MVCQSIINSQHEVFWPFLNIIEFWHWIFGFYPIVAADPKRQGRASFRAGSSGQFECPSSPERALAAISKANAVPRRDRANFQSTSEAALFSSGQFRVPQRGSRLERPMRAPSEAEQVERLLRIPARPNWRTSSKSPKRVRAAL